MQEQSLTRLSRRIEQIKASKTISAEIKGKSALCYGKELKTAGNQAIFNKPVVFPAEIESG